MITRTRNSFRLLCILLFLSLTSFAFADAATQIKKFQTEITAITTPLGQIIMLVGVIFFGKSLAGQDPRGKSDAVLIVAAGAIITGASEFLRS